MMGIHYLFATTLVFVVSTDIASAFQLPKVFGGLPKLKIENGPSLDVTSVEKQKKAILEAVSGTDNGKSATPEQQDRVLKLVRKLETDFPPSPELLSNPTKAQILNGTWYLQYTSPSEVGYPDQFPDAWKPVAADEGDSKVETKQFNARGTISATGITIDTSNKPVKQIFDVANSRVLNDVSFDWGRASVGGQFRQSNIVANRAVVKFDTAILDINKFGKGLSVNLGFLFSLLSKLRGSKEDGWLEISFVDNDMRIGRGNKGTMFVLTRDPNAVQP